MADKAEQIFSLSIHLNDDLIKMLAFLEYPTMAQMAFNSA